MSDSLIIEVQVRQSYGRNLVYPINERGRDLAYFAGIKTFNEAHLYCLKRVGFKLVFVGQVLEGFKVD